MFKLIISLILVNMPLFAQESPASHIWSEEAFKSTTTYGKGALTITEGIVDGQPLYIESSRTGKLTISQGSLDGRPVNTSTIRLNRLNITTGTVGNEEIEVITYSHDKD